MGHGGRLRAVLESIQACQTEVCSKTAAVSSADGSGITGIVLLPKHN